MWRDCQVKAGLSPPSAPQPPHTQDESRHGDFLAATLKCQPELLEGTAARLWSRFFCLSVYITMYLNDHQRSFFYESLGMDTTRFNKHVILETNNTTERIFPEVRGGMEAFWESEVGVLTGCTPAKGERHVGAAFLT